MCRGGKGKIQGEIPVTHLEKKFGIHKRNGAKLKHNKESKEVWGSLKKFDEV